MDARRRMISKNFHHVLRVAERQTLAGPPESMREHIVAASKAMKTGDWKACKNYIINEKMNTKVCSDTPQSIYVPPTEGGGHIVFGADPIVVRVRVASFRCDIF